MTGDAGFSLSREVGLSRVPALPKGQLFLKRAMDLMGAFGLLLLLSPLLLIIALAVRVSSPGPILFRQKRWGI